MKIIKVGKYLSLAIISLGLIHNAATIGPSIKSGLSCLPVSEQNTMLYMSLMCGSSLIISGLILYVLLNKLPDYPFLITPIIILGVFLAFNGISIAIYFDSLSKNPFAIIGIALNLSMFLITTFLAFKFKKKLK